MSSIRLAAGLIAVLGVLLPMAEGQAKVGVASAVEGGPKALPPAGTERTLFVGTDMEANEKVTTGPDDRAHLVFLDGTSVTIGPDSALVIDKFVFDPSTKSGDMALTMSKGTMRFVGGVISKRSEVKVTTPSAVMGIRGGVMTVEIQINGVTVANFLYGSYFSFTSGGVTRSTTTPNMQVTSTPGGPPSQPRNIPPGTIGSHFASFSRGRPSTTGGPGRQRFSALVRTMLTNARFGRLNSGLTPIAARNSTPSPVQITARLTSFRGGPGGSQQAQARTVNLGGMVTALAGKVDTATATALVNAVVAGDSAAIGSILNSNANNPAVLAAMASALTASGDAGLIANVVAGSSGNASVVGAVATAVAGTGNAALIANVVVASGGNATVVNAVGTAVANTNNPALVTAVTANVAATSPTIASSLGTAVIAANPTMSTAVSNAGVTPAPPPTPPPLPPPPPPPTPPPPPSQN